MTQMLMVGYYIAHSNPICWWELGLGTSKQLEMLAMGMHTPVNVEGGTIKRKLRSFVASIPIFKLHPHTRPLHQLWLVLVHKTCTDEEYFTQIAEYCQVMHSLTIGYNGSLDERWPLITFVTKLGSVVELIICFSANNIYMAIDNLPLSFSSKYVHPWNMCGWWASVSWHSPTSCAASEHPISS